MATVFHSLVRIDEALELIDNALGGLKPLGVERVSLDNALGRVLAEDVLAKMSYPPFDRSTVDGYAVKASDTYTATEENPAILKIVGYAGVGAPHYDEVKEGECVEIATGAPVPRGANAVAMVEFTKRLTSDRVMVFRPVAPNENIAQAGSDISVGDTVLRRGALISPREIAVLASVGVKEVTVYRQVSVAVFSTGNEVTAVGEPLELGKIYDVNGPTLTAMLKELGARADFRGIIPDDYDTMVREVRDMIRLGYDIVITSGSTSAGFGDMIYKVFGEISDGHVLVHGLKVKPGKPTVVAVAGKNLLIGLPGFPLSAMMVFHKLVKPVVEALGGIRPRKAGSVKAKMAYRIEAGKGKLELIPVQIITNEADAVAYPLIGQSGSTHLLSIADGILEAPENREFFEEGEEVEITLLSEKIRPAQLVIIGSHCPGIDLLLSSIDETEAKVINVGSTAGWNAVKRGEADIAGTHLLEQKTREYNVFMLDRLGLHGKAVLVRGYARKIGFVTRKDSPIKITSFRDLVEKNVSFVNRIKGSGVRTFIDMMLAEIGVASPYKQIRGYDYEVRTHTGVAAAVKFGRADVGVTLESVAKQYDLDFTPLGEEVFDFVIPVKSLSKIAVRKFINKLSDKSFQAQLESTLHGYRILPDTGKIISQ
ncbi:MAG: molybdopterin biosynthesis protein [Candidatus Caldarchaeum sp.]